MAVAPASTAAQSWPSPELLREHAPVVRLLGAIWAIPEVTKIGMTLGRHSVDLWVFTSVDSPEIESVISGAERVYRAAARSNGFTLHVIPEGVVPADALPPYDTLIER
jgi:hypothetical protein